MKCLPTQEPVATMRWNVMAGSWHAKKNEKPEACTSCSTGQRDVHAESVQLR